MSLDQATLAKYAAGALLIASVFGLVFVGKVDANQYLGIVYAALAALGINAAAK